MPDTPTPPVRAELIRELRAGVTCQITSDPNIQDGDWCIAGQRIPAAAIKSFAGAGYTTEQIIREYPSLTPEQVAAR